MPVFGLTGNLSCGKSTALMLLKDKGACVFDVDKRIHEYYKDKKSGIFKKISVLFPQAIRKNRIDREKLGEIVFSDRKNLRKLEKIVHPIAIRDLKSWAKKAKNTNRVSVAEVPLLFEKNLAGIFDGTILIYAKKSVLLKRIKIKLKLSKAAAGCRLSAFKPVREKSKRADFIINNSFTIETLKREIDILWKNLNSNFKGENKTNG
ncbi:MAG: dephospho-CoA kinase [Candidatus Omnitrophica bacterium]|nr:dephospho-CoA kinase [Candidatus Omnitrophota bacterium]